jgi:hypothetical protein
MSRQKINAYIKTSMTFAAFPVEAVVPRQEPLPLHANMEYTNVLSLERLEQLFTANEDVFVSVKSTALHAPTLEELYAPMTSKGQKILFELSEASFHAISDEHDLPVRVPHSSSTSEAIPIHIVLNAEEDRILDLVDEDVKKDFREEMEAELQRKCFDDKEFKKQREKLVSWFPLVKTSFGGRKVLMTDLVLGGEAPTQLLLLKNRGSQHVEGEGTEFLKSHIGEIGNLKDYECNPVLEMAWVMFRESENAYRLRVKIHSLMLRKKVEGPPLKRMKMSASKIKALCEANRLVSLTNTF